MEAIGYVKCVDTEGDKRLTEGRIYYVYAIDPQGGQFLIMSNNYFEWHNTGRFVPATKATIAQDLEKALSWKRR